MRRPARRIEPLTEGAVAAALGAVLGSLIVYRLPFGGSVSLGGTVPILIVALRRGPQVGMVAGAVLGVLNFLGSAAPAVHVIQPVLDYPIAYSLLGLAGFFSRRPIVGVVVGGLAKLCCHVISGVVFFASYAGDAEMSPWIYSLSYNATVMVPDLLVAIVLLSLLIVRIPSVLLPRGSLKGAS